MESRTFIAFRVGFALTAIALGREAGVNVLTPHFRRAVMVALAALLPLVLPLAAAHATTAVYYSPADSYYGWCAGHSASRAEQCASSYCAANGHTDCKLALACPDGWGATASAEAPAKGMGSSCNVGNPFMARSIAIASCLVSANALCWTDSAFYRGRTTSKSDNLKFDLTWYAQDMLSMDHLAPGAVDGAAGPKTRAAVKQFQTLIGVSPTGVIDDTLIRRLLDSVGGIQGLSENLKKNLIATYKDTFANKSFSYAARPVLKVDFNTVLKHESAADRLTALATLLSAAGDPCSAPALSAVAVPDNNGEWAIDCKEASYMMTLGVDGKRTIVTMDAGATAASGSPPNNAAAGTVSDNAPPTGSGTSPQPKSASQGDAGRSSAQTARGGSPGSSSPGNGSSDQGAGAGLAQAPTPRAAFLARELASRVGDLDKMFRGVSITVDVPDNTKTLTYVRTAIKGISISLGSDQVLSVKYRTCELSPSLVKMKITWSGCETAAAWDANDDTYSLPLLHPQSINVEKVDPASGNSWYDVGFAKDFGNTIAASGSIYCADKAQCGKMARDLLMAYVIAHPLPPAPRDIPYIVERIKDFTTGLTFRQKRTINGKKYDLTWMIGAIGVDSGRTRLLMQDRVCGVPEGHICDQKADWIQRRSMVLFAGLSPDVSVDRSAALSESGKIGAVVLKCMTGKPCMAQEAKGQSKPQAIRALEIPCTLKGGCAEMKAEMEELISSLRTAGH